MATTAVTISNLALGKIGSRPIIALDEESPEARVCALHYDETRDEVLRAHPWNFAIRRRNLSELTGVTVPDEWAHAWQLPEDCLRVMEINETPDGGTHTSWIIEGRVVYTQDNRAALRYVARIEDANYFDSIFVEALSVKLASKICRPLLGTTSLNAEFIQEYNRLTAGLARRIDAVESRRKRIPAWQTSDLVAARLGR